jgi:chemotaxis protein methyltransferase CheR
MLDMSINEMKPADFQRFSEMVRRHSGIHLGLVKTELLRARLAKRMRALSLTSFKDYYEVVLEDESGEELARMLDVVTTNKTEFFREDKHFVLLAQRFLPQLLKEAAHRADKTLRIWSAACSSGEEAYTLAMCALEASVGMDVKVKILATDLSSRMIHRAVTGVYEKEKTQGVPRSLLQKYFEVQGKGEERTYRVGEALRGMVQFHRFNLNSGVLPFRNLFDIIFCRNVMIYFEQAVQEDLVGRMAGVLRKGGYLFTGLAESLLAIKHPLKSVAASVYVKP